jgi:RNA polymerase sigma-70 factor (ECF subfamily)
MTDARRDEGLGPEALVLQRERAEEVKRAVETLPADFRDVIVLRELEGLSYKEISAIVGVPLGTVMSRLSRARERLLVLLGPAVSDGGSA